MAQYSAKREYEEPISTNKAGDLDGLTGVDGLGSFFKAITSYERMPSERCPACGYSVHELVATGLLGCPACYELFADVIWRQIGKSDLVS